MCLSYTAQHRESQVHRIVWIEWCLDKNAVQSPLVYLIFAGGLGGWGIVMSWIS